MQIPFPLCRGRRGWVVDFVEVFKISFILVLLCLRDYLTGISINNGEIMGEALHIARGEIRARCNGNKTAWCKRRKRRQNGHKNGYICHDVRADYKLHVRMRKRAEKGRKYKKCLSASRLFCRAVALSVKFNGCVYYAYDAEHGKDAKQINQFHIYCFLLSDSTENETPATARITTTASPDRISARRFISKSISPASMMPPNTSFEISMQYFPISANSVFFLSSVIVPVVSICKDNIFE